MTIFRRDTVWGGDGRRELGGLAAGSCSTYVGTAGLMSDCWLAAGLLPTMSSLSRMVFSVDMILRVDILKTRHKNWLMMSVWVENGRVCIGFQRVRIERLTDHAARRVSG